MLLATFIVRLYRFQKNKPRALLGVVEEVGRKGKKAFTNYDELWGILNSPQSGKSQVKIDYEKIKRKEG